LIRRRKAHGMQVAWTLAKREWIRFFRQPFRVIAALGQPILFWLLFGTGFHQAFRGGNAGESFMGYYIAGTVALILLFTAIFSTISIIEDRKEGFLQGVLVAPAPRWAIAVGKSLGGAAIALAQALLFVGLALCVGMLPVGWHLIPLVGFLAVCALAITGMGVCFAWPMESTQGYHAAMNMVMLPMWMLSGAFFPIPAGADALPTGQRVMQILMQCNPMSYMVAGIRHFSGVIQPSTIGPSSTDPINSMTVNSNMLVQGWIPSVQASCLWTLVFAVFTFCLSTLLVRRRQRGEFA